MRPLRCYNGVMVRDLIGTEVVVCDYLYSKVLSNSWDFKWSKALHYESVVQSVLWGLHAQ
jgi:hypothetical protein